MEEPNLGRQLFSPSELGLNKAVALVSRINRFYGTRWEGVPERFDEKTLYVDSFIRSPKSIPMPNIIITCTDSIASRRIVAETFGQLSRRTTYDEDRVYYWLDLGNAQSTGQVILGSSAISQPKSSIYKTVATLPTASDVFSGWQGQDDGDSGPSCSMAEAISRQDPYINSTLGQFAGRLLLQLFRESVISVRGLYLNLDTLTVAPIPV